MLETTVEPGPRIPAIRRLRQRYGRHYGCLRGDIVNKKAKLAATLKGKPNKKFTKHELTQLDMAEAEYKTRRHREQDPTPYSGSEDAMEHRLGMRLPRR